MSASQKAFMASLNNDVAPVKDLRDKPDGAFVRRGVYDLLGNGSSSGLSGGASFLGSLCGSGSFGSGNFSSGSFGSSSFSSSSFGSGNFSSSSFGSG